MRRAILVLVLAASAAVFAGAQTDTLDYAMLGRIRDEGLTRSQVMDHISWMSDVYGPRLTGSPGIQQAGEWCGGALRSRQRQRYGGRRQRSVVAAAAS
jgi:carboxypeptidase Q